MNTRLSHLLEMVHHILRLYQPATTIDAKHEVHVQQQACARHHDDQAGRAVAKGASTSDQALREDPGGCLKPHIRVPITSIKLTTTSVDGRSGTSGLNYTVVMLLLELGSGVATLL
jgi:hypothetical protein